MSNHRLFLILFLLIINIISTLSQSCTSNLECKDTGCCKDDQCTDDSECKRRNKFCYGFVGVGAFVVLVVIIIYFIRKIKQTKKHLEYLRKTDASARIKSEEMRRSQILNMMNNPAHNH